MSVAPGGVPCGTVTKIVPGGGVGWSGRRTSNVSLYDLSDAAPRGTCTRMVPAGDSSWTVVFGWQKGGI